MVYTKLKVPQWDAKFAPHASCSWKCLQILSGKNLFQPSEYKIYSPYMAPLLHGNLITYLFFTKISILGWTREVCYFIHFISTPLIIIFHILDLQMPLYKAEAEKRQPAKEGCI